jgi:hypothetical protein
MKKLRIRMEEVNIYIYMTTSFPRDRHSVFIFQLAQQQTTSLNLVKCVFPLEAEKGSGLATSANSKGAPAWQ